MRVLVCSSFHFFSFVVLLYIYRWWLGFHALYYIFTRPMRFPFWISCLHLLHLLFWLYSCWVVCSVILLCGSLYFALLVLATPWLLRLRKAWCNVQIRFEGIILIAWRKARILRALILNSFSAMSCRFWISWWVNRSSLLKFRLIRPWINWSFRV